MAQSSSRHVRPSLQVFESAATASESVFRPPSLSSSAGAAPAPAPVCPTVHVVRG